MMNGVKVKRGDANPPGPYFPFHRDETYPRTLCVNFKRLEFRTLHRYCKLHGINVRPDCTQPELAVAAARHFQEAPSVDEEGVMTSFLKRVIDPDRPYRPAIDLAVTTTRHQASERARSLGSGGAALDSGHNDEDYDEALEGVEEEQDGRGRRGTGVMDARDGRGGGYHHQGYRHGHSHGPLAYEDKPRVDGYGGRGGIGGREGGPGGYEHEMDYGRPPPPPPPPPQSQMSAPWDADGHGGDMTPKNKRSGGGSRGNRFARGSGSAPAHGGGPAMTGRDVIASGGNGGGGGSGGGVSGNGGGGGGGDESKSRKHKMDPRGSGGAGGSGAGDGSAKPPPGKKRKGGGGWRAKNGEQVAVRDDREDPGAWILARVIKYVPETHHYELKDDDDKEGMDVLTAPRALVIRLEDTTKGVQRGDRVLAVFPDTTSFYLGVVHRVPKTAVGAERRIEVKFNDDADDNGRTPARPLPARYVVPLPEGYDEDEGKPEEDEGHSAAGAGGGGGSGGGGGCGGRAEEEADDAIVTEEDDADGPPYAEMIRTALMKLPGRQGNLVSVCAYIEEHFHDRLNWKSESSLRRTPAWKSSVRRTLAHHPDFCHAGTPERNVYTLAE